MYTSGSLEEEIVMVEGGYKASRCIKPVFSFSEDLNILRISCKIIDMIAKVDEVHSENTSKEIFQTAIKPVRENAESLSMKLSSTGLEAKVREVLVVGKSGGYVDWFRDEVSQNVMNRRRFFFTKAGNFGVGPAGMKEGQIVCVVAGCNFPIILCEEGDHYLLAGEAFGTSMNISRKCLLTQVVRKMMRGEALKIDSLPWQEIEIYCVQQILWGCLFMILLVHLPPPA
jgi:hypothetical protein